MIEERLAIILKVRKACVGSENWTVCYKQSRVQ